MAMSTWRSSCTAVFIAVTVLCLEFGVGDWTGRIQDESILDLLRGIGVLRVQRPSGPFSLLIFATTLTHRWFPVRSIFISVPVLPLV